jgi:outer membrane protein assembly factor BamD (BamD/ComL family)
MTRTVHLLAIGLLALAAIPPALTAQANVEEQARRQYESGLEFYRAGRYAEALKDFQTVAEGYATSAVADDAMLAIAEYQLDVLHDPIAARTSAETLVKKYATGDAAPMGYVISGRATMALDPSAAGMDSALASFDRVPRLFPRSEAVAPSLYYAAEIDRRAGRASEALDKLRRVAQGYPRTTWAARASLMEAALVLADGEPQEAMRALQRVVRRYGSGEEASTARAWNTILYRLYIRPPAQAPYVASGRSIAGTGGRLRDVEDIALAPDGKLGVATRGGVLLLDAKGAIVRQAASLEPRQIGFDERGRFVVIQKTLVSREGDKGYQRLPLTAGQGASARLLQDIAAGARLSTGELIVADREVRSAGRFDATGKFLGNFAGGRFSRVAVGPGDEVALIDADANSVTWADRTGKVLAKIPARGTGYLLDDPADVAFDVFQHLYVLDKTKVVIFAPGGKLVATFTPDAANAFRSGSALALDGAARLHIYDDAQGRVLIYQ